MNKIIFPGFGLEMSVSRVAFRIGNISIYWYAIFIVFAIIIAMLCLKKEKDKYDVSFDSILELCLWLFPVSIVCARLYYCIFYFKDEQQTLINFLDFRSGGLAIYGGIIGGVITIILYGKKNKIKIGNILDRCVPYLALGQAIGRLGNFVNVEAYGTQTNLPWRMGIWENGIYKEVHPTFLYESIVTLVIFILLAKRKKQNFVGENVVIYLIFYSIARTIIEPLRIDSLYFMGVRISQVVSIIILIVTILWYIIGKVHRKDTKT